MLSSESCKKRIRKFVSIDNSVALLLLEFREVLIFRSRLRTIILRFLYFKVCYNILEDIKRCLVVMAVSLKDCVI